MTSRRLACLLYGCALTLSGCGSAPSTMVDNGQQIAIQQPASQGAMPQSPDSQTMVPGLLQAVATTYQRTRNFQCDLTGYFINQASGQPKSSQAHLTFERPNTSAITIEQSSDGNTVGTQLIWDGGSQVKVKTKFLGFWVKTSVDLHDSRLADQRGNSIDQTAFIPTMETLLDPRNQVHFLGMGQLDGFPVAQLDVSSPRSLPGIRHEVFTINLQQNTPAMREMYDSNNQLVYRMRFSNVIVNAQLPSSAFTLN